jgi:DNA-binding CsgD family transcriptional regulator
MWLDNEIHAAVFEPERFQKVMAGLAEAVGAQKGLIWTHQATYESTRVWVPYRLGEQSLINYTATYRQHDIWNQAVRAQGEFDQPGKLRIGSERMPRAALLQALVYREFHARYHICDVLGGTLHNGSDLRVPVIYLALYRETGQPVFVQEDKARLAPYLPALICATHAAFLIAHERQRADTAQLAADMALPALLLIGSSGAVVFSNHKAHCLLQANDGLFLQNERLLDSSGYDLGNALIASGKILGAGAPTLIARPSGKPSLILRSILLCGKHAVPCDAHRPHIALLILAREQLPKVDERMLRELFGLTPAEARVVQALRDFGAPKQAALQMSVSVHTVRAQLKSILAKTGTHSQVELARLIESLSLHVASS